MGIWSSWRRKRERAQKKAQISREEGFCFDRARHKPVIRASICTGEQVAGFKDRHTGRFTEIMLIRNNDDMEKFLIKFGLTREELTREW